MKRPVLDEIALHDAQHRFLPLLADKAGFRVEQMQLPQALTGRQSRLHRPVAHVDGLLDLASVGFLLKFFQKPFRFFGTIGLAAITVGLLVGTWIVIERLFMGEPLADRPALLLATLLVVLGIQIAAVGLIAEIIIFTRSDRTPTFRIQRIVERRGAPSAPPA